MIKYLAFIAALAVIACTPTPVPISQTDLQNKVLAVETAYEIPLLLAVAYNQRPRCRVPKTVVLCSDTAIIEKLRTANHIVLAALGAAAQTASTPGITADVVNAAIVTAANAVAAFQLILTNER